MKSEIKARQWIMKTQLEKSTRLRHSMLVGVLVSVAILAGSASAQTFTVSNIDATPGATHDTLVINEEAWRAVSFTPGANTDRDNNAYSIESFVANYALTFGNAERRVSIYDDNAGAPGTQIGSFDAVNNGGGDAVGEGGIRVSESMLYWLVFGSDDGFGHQYNVYATDLDTQTTTGASSPWMIGDTSLASTDDGVNWVNASDSLVPEFTLNATAIPEPSEYVLASAFVIGIFILTRRRRSFG